jgi:RimJ/RimL family protein N-acetyltransferase
MGLFVSEEARMIEGTIVNLRAQDMDDLERNTRWINDREVTHFLAARYQFPLIAEESWLLERSRTMPSYADMGLAIDTKDGRHIGNVGLHRGSPEERTCELGIMIGEKDCWGGGYGTDALRTIARFAFEEMNMNRIGLDVYAFNTRAMRAYEKAGFVEEGRRRQDLYKDGEYHDVVMMSLLREDWEKAP